ncbi:P-loop NTPase fold protein [Alcanivorax sp. NBRC 102028]|uniref:P-loop NTPase fold protein n=1 Tax=Alcanivorax sp. NBRC 102028 TaxID=1113897 RepID=UPI000789DBEE|nr:P-loop NTPase fold protein [Alcanivorax sp. NBRC 102028]
MKNLNGHITDFLNYYNKLDGDPGYAVMLNGPWGSGKTWFVKKYLESFEGAGGKCLYVSLYGVQSIADIESEFFRQLHPLLSSKAMKLTGKLLTGVLKTSFRFDYDGDDSADGSISSQVTSIDISQYLEKPGGFMLVFDDLERAVLDKVSLLGYINHFVEFQGCKVIVVGNEKEIEPSGNYLNIKEKLIGKTFLVSADFGAAFDEFVDRLSDSAKDFCLKNREMIFDYYERSGFNNLRHLRQILSDFSRLYEVLPDESSKKDGLLENILKFFLVLGMESRHGTLTQDEMKSLDSGVPSLLPGSKEEKESPFDELQKKYAGIGAYDMLLDGGMWADIIYNGKIERAALEESLRKSFYFIDERTPDWEVLWKYRDLSDPVFTDLLNKVSQKFNDRYYKDPLVLKHVVGLLTELSNIGLYSESVEAISDIARECVDNIAEEGGLLGRMDCSFPEQEYGGQLGFHGLDLDAFQDFSSYLANKYEEVTRLSYPSQAKGVVELLFSDISKFYGFMVPSNHGDQRYAEIPILKYVDPGYFADCLISISPVNRRVVCYAVLERCKRSSSFSVIKEEKDWLVSVVSILKEKSHENSGTLLGVQLKQYVDDFLVVAVESL